MEIDKALEEAISEAVSEARQSKEVERRLIAWFETLAKAERSHANRFTKALENMN